MKISIVFLTYNRRDRVVNQMRCLKKLSYSPLEIIVVDNASDCNIEDIVLRDRRAAYVRNEINYGAVGRNKGIEKATGEVIVTLDDDVYGITDYDLLEISKIMINDDKISAINFKVIEENTGKLINWCHPYDEDFFSNIEFETIEISEGAVAFRRSSLLEVGLYPEYFFISHEGPDMALRLVNAGFKVVYRPNIEVIHAYEMESRVSWRRYYFDTRNLLWLILRNLSGWYAIKRLMIGWGAMLVYSIRDGYFIYWVRAIFDSLKGAPRAWKDRVPPTKQAKRTWKYCHRHQASFLKLLKKRLFQKEVRV